MLIIAHRGASGRFPENTLRAFRAAVDAGADMCELDVQFTRDGGLAVIHDDRVDRSTDGAGLVAAMSLEELRRLDAGIRFGQQFKGERIPTLDEVFAATKGLCALNVELKSAGVERAVCDCVRANDAFDSIIVSSFDWAALSHIREIDRRIPIGLLAKRAPTRMLAAAAAMGAEAIHPRFDLISQSMCDAAHQRNLSVYAWTVDDVGEMKRLRGCGVDGIMTNFPERLRDLVRS
jgi:glycerophosphoryl diester phosphodiesterase